MLKWEQLMDWVILGTFGEDLPADQTHINGHVANGQRQHGIEKSGAQHSGNQDTQQHARQAGPDIQKPHDDSLCPAPEITGNTAYDTSHDRAEQCGADAKGKGIASAVEQTAEQVPSHCIRAEDMSS